jgi:hypothetical protein
MWELLLDVPYWASFANIYNNRAIADAVCCAADLELVGVDGGQVVHEVLQKNRKKNINIRSTSGWTL